MKQIVIANNQWGNIGNAFFMLSLKAMLEKVFVDKAVVVSGEDLPPPPLKSRYFRDICFYNPILSYSCDYYVISGPVFSKDFARRWSPQLLKLIDNGVKIIIMSAGSDQYDDEEKEIVRTELKKIKPFILTTRDKETYDAFADLATYSHNGICTAFFSSYHYKGINKKTLDPTCVLGFEKSNEPTLKIIKSSDYEEIDVDIRSIKKLNKLQQFMDSYKDHKVKIDKYKIIRPLHEPSAILTNELFRRPNRHTSFNPYSYLDIFREAEFTISERVHACVPALSYGKKAMLVKDTKRAKLFDRAGLSQINKEVVSISLDFIEEEYNDYIDFLLEIDM